MVVRVHIKLSCFVHFERWKRPRHYDLRQILQPEALDEAISTVTIDFHPVSSRQQTKQDKRQEGWRRTPIHHHHHLLDLGQGYDSCSLFIDECWQLMHNRTRAGKPGSRHSTPCDREMVRTRWRSVKREGSRPLQDMEGWSTKMAQWPRSGGSRGER